MNKIFNLSFLISLILILSFASIYQVKGADLKLNIEEYPSFGGIEIDENTDINELVAWGYYFLVGISGFSAFFMFVWGGFEWSSSMGNPTRQGEAKEKLTSAAIGLLIVLSAYLILNVINPDLTILKLPEM